MDPWRFRSAVAAVGDMADHGAAIVAEAFAEPHGDHLSHRRYVTEGRLQIMRSGEGKLFEVFVRALQGERYPGEFVLGFSSFRNVPENQYCADSLAVVIADGRGAVVDINLAAVPGDQLRVIGKTNRMALGYGPFERIFDCFACCFVDDSEHFRDAAVRAVAIIPASQLFGNGVEEIYFAGSVSGDHAVGYAREGDGEFSLARASLAEKLVAMV
jgi:hypothetical protein